jgi:hypothetical protein
MVRSLGTIAARLLFVVGLRWSVLGFVVADLIVSLVLFAGLMPTFQRMTTWRFSPALARELIMVGLPRVPHGALHQITSMADRVLLSWYLSLDQLGLYSIGSDRGLHAQALTRWRSRPRGRHCVCGHDAARMLPCSTRGRPPTRLSCWRRSRRARAPVDPSCVCSRRWPIIRPQP